MPTTANPLSELPVAIRFALAGGTSGTINPLPAMTVFLIESSSSSDLRQFEKAKVTPVKLFIEKKEKNNES